MCSVVLFPKHRLFRCYRDKADRFRCEAGQCPYCCGGLSFCMTCKGGEGDLPTECPQVSMSAGQKEFVYNGVLDFVGGEWVITEPPERKFDRHDLPIL